MEKPLIEKLRELVEQHNKETGERLSSLHVSWIIVIGGKGQVEKISIDVEK